MGRFSDQRSNFNQGEVSPRYWARVDLDEMYLRACKDITNFIVQAHGPVTKRMGSKYVAEVKHSDKYTRVIPFEVSNIDSYIIEMGEGYFRFYKDGAQVWATVSGVPLLVYEVDNDYTEDELPEVKFVQDADVMFMVHPDHPVKQLTRYSDADWEFEDLDFDPPAFGDLNASDITLTPSDVTGDIGVTASDDLFTANHVGSDWRIAGILTRSVSANSGDDWSDFIEMDAGESIIVSIDGSYSGCTTTVQRKFSDGGSWVDYKQWTINTSVELIESRDNVKYRIGVKSGDHGSGTVEASISKLDQYGYFEVTHFSNATTISGTVKRDLPNTEDTTLWSPPAWSKETGYPRAVGLYEGRLLLAGTTNEPQKIWASKVEQYDSFENLNDFDDESYAFTIKSRMINTILWLIDKDILHIGTLGGEYRLGYKNEATTPTSVYYANDSGKGSDIIQAIDAAGDIIFAQRGGKKLITQVWNYERERFQAIEISEKAEHILQNGVNEIEFVQRPDPQIHTTTNSGTLVTCTYEPNNKVIAFHKHETDGYYESIAAKGDRFTNEDQLWYVARREIGSTAKRYIEYFDSPTWSNVSLAYFVDSGLEYDGAPTTVVSGLEHLEGKEVVVLGDAGYMLPRTVVSGVVNFDYEVSHAIVGLPYDSTLETLNLEYIYGGVTTTGKPKNIFKCYIDLEDTVGLEVGYRNDDTDDVPFRSFDDPLDTAIPPYTGTKELVFNHGYDKAVSLVIKHSYPTPCTIKSVAMTVKTNKQ